MVDLILKNAAIPEGDALIVCDILVDNGIIAGIVKDSSHIDSDREIDAQGHMTLPGCIDSHVHFMDPGFCHRETFLSGTSAAAAGGITTVIDMPCCSIPSVRDISSMDNKIAAIEQQAIVDYALWGGVTGEDVRDGLLDNVEKQVNAGVVGFKAYMTPSVPSYPRSNDAELLEIFKTVALTGLPLGVHAENYTICDYMVNKLQREGRKDSVAWENARLSLAEKVAIEMCISFSEYSGARMHIVHMSTGAGAILIKEAKQRGLKVTAETCPHYLLLNAEESMGKWGSFAKIAPPLRHKEDNEIMWEMLRNGVVDFVATDHAPYEIATEKAADGMNIWNSFPGIPGVETMAPILISEGYNKGRISLSRLVEILSKNAAIHYGLYPRKGKIAIGFDADFSIFDTEKEWIFKSKDMHSMAKYSPFEDMRFKGKAIKTIVRGEVVFDNGEIVGKPGYGQFVKRQNIMELDRTIRIS